MRALILTAVAILAGCETTNSIPYKASTSNIIAIKQVTAPKSLKVNVGTVELAGGVEEHPMCRLMGPVTVAPGKTLPQYIKDAFVEELYAAQAFDPQATNVINARIDSLSFSSVSPASWSIAVSFSSTALPGGYGVAETYRFDTSFTAFSACKNVADAFGPAVQELLGHAVASPDFAALVGAH